MMDQIKSGLAPIEQLLERLNVNAVFGPPTQVGDTTVIPVAEVSVMFAYGAGGGPGSREDGEPGAAADGETGGGAGGGAIGKAVPRGYLRITAEGVTFEPAVDPMRISLSGMALGAWSIYWIASTIRAFAKRKK